MRQTDNTIKREGGNYKLPSLDNGTARKSVANIDSQFNVRQSYRASYCHRKWRLWESFEAVYRNLVTLFFCDSTFRN
jgi:hypothetical protein